MLNLRIALLQRARAAHGIRAREHRLRVEGHRHLLRGDAPAPLARGDHERKRLRGLLLPVGDERLRLAQGHAAQLRAVDRHAREKRIAAHSLTNGGIRFICRHLLLIDFRAGEPHSRAAQHDDQRPDREQAPFLFCIGPSAAAAPRGPAAIQSHIVQFSSEKSVVRTSSPRQSPRTAPSHSCGKTGCAGCRTGAHC